ncbi:MAG: hypothetical protein ACYCTV_02670 [Leptospirales bacterium]
MNDTGSSFDPLDPDSGKSRRGIPLLWILLPIFLVFLAMMGSTLWHVLHGDYLGFAAHQNLGGRAGGK